MVLTQQHQSAEAAGGIKKGRCALRGSMREEHTSQMTRAARTGPAAAEAAADTGLHAAARRDERSASAQTAAKSSHASPTSGAAATAARPSHLIAAHHAAAGRTRQAALPRRRPSAATSADAAWKHTGSQRL